ncbi:MAG: beta-ketoacyl-[acyl-carrier-protein] synthase family protein, partial [Opitutaceae bacterium]
YDLSANHVQNGGEVDVDTIEQRLPPLLRRADPCIKFAFDAARQALSAAGRFTWPPPEMQDIGSIWGCAAGPTEMLLQANRCFAEKGPNGMRPSAIPSCMANSISAQLSIAFRTTGPNYVIASACTSGANAIGVAFRMIRGGHAEAVLCGGTDAPFSAFQYAGWNNLGVFSNTPDAARAVRPFGVDRTGTLLGEGAGALVLESLSSALRRGVRIRGEIAGYGESSDATHVTGPSVSGQAKACRAALHSAGIEPESVGYINAHGTGTGTNDATEAEAIREVMGGSAGTIPVGAMKSYFGHTLGASGAIESIGALLALEHRLAPPNLNLENPDPACALHLIGSAPFPLTTDFALKNSFGFGGGNAVLVLRRYG